MAVATFLDSTVRRYRIVLTCERTVESATCRSEAWWWCAHVVAFDDVSAIGVVWRRDPIAAVVARSPSRSVKRRDGRSRRARWSIA